MREKGYVPSAGIVVFNQIDKKKTREIDVPALTELLTALKVRFQSQPLALRLIGIGIGGPVSCTFGSCS